MRWLLLVLAVLRGRRKGVGEEEEERIVAPGAPDRRAENVVLALLVAATLLAVGFVVVYALDGIGHQTQLLGIALAGSLLMLAAALIVVGKRLVVVEELEEDYPGENRDDQEAVAQILEESTSRFTRKRLLAAAGAGAGTALGAALVTPALSLGPLLDTSALYDTPWRRGRRLVDADNRPLAAAAILPETFYSAFPEGADRDAIASPLIVVRLDPSALRLPPERARWAPGGILAFSKICTHAGCAISLYRKPTFKPTQPRPALVCPCHYSTFDPARGGKVIFGPAGRPLPQLPLVVDAAGQLRAGGNYSAPVGPSWSGVREKGPS